MCNKPSRQPDANGKLSEVSTNSCDESNTADDRCTHIVKALSFSKIKKCINTVGISAECSVCKKNKIDVPKVCEDTQECARSTAILICLQCGHQGCGKEQFGHALEHYKKPCSDFHFMVVEINHWTVWCFECEKNVNIGPRLQEPIEFIKKNLNKKSNASQAKAVVTQCQKGISDVDKKERDKLLHNLPKVGGLMNLGNTCFFNAVLQCLSQTPFLVKILEDLRLPGQKIVLPGGKHKFSNSSEETDLPPIEGTLEGYGCFTSILAKTLREMQLSDGSQAYRPSELLNSFKKKNMQCMDGGQHDSHELLRHLLEIVRSEDLKRYKSIILKELGLNGKTNPEEVEDELRARVKFYGNQANAKLLGTESVFRGVLVSTLKCIDCNHISQSTEPFLDLSLPVMPEKPQPPILKRKNNGDDSFDIMGNNISHAPSKHHLKKEKKAARKNRKNKRHEAHNHGDSIMCNKGNILEKSNDPLESEDSDADVEDNVEMETILPEIGNPDFSSDKPSTLESPVTPLIEQNKTMETTNDVTLDNDLPSSATDIVSLVQLENCNETNSSLSAINTRGRNILHTKVLDGFGSSESIENESGIQTGLSLSTSLAVTSDLTSPDVPTISLNSVSSRESPTSSICNLTNGESGENIKLPMHSIKSIEPLNHNDKAVLKQRKARRKVEEYANEINNGITCITSGISKIDIGGSPQQSPTRYSIKEGEYSVQSCLNQFTALELMSGSNKVGCEACTARQKKIRGNCNMVCTKSTKQYLISRVPAVLILHLKRMQAQRIDFRKVTRHISFPSLLDLAPICKKHKKPRIYALYGVVEHSGTIHGGHYVAYVKTREPLASDDHRWSFLPSKDAKSTQEHVCSSSSDSETEEAAATLPSTLEPPPGKWYLVSDSRVTEVDETTVLRSQAYLLFYERIR